MSFCPQMEQAFASIFTPESGAELAETYSPATEPLFSADDPNAVEIRTVDVGDRFIAMFSGEYELLRHDGMHTYARHIATGVEQVFGNRAVVLPRVKGVAK